MAVVFRVNCPSCGTGFDIDRYRIPAAGIAAVCSQCSRTFRIEAPVDVAPASEAAPAASAPVRKSVTPAPEATPSAAPAASAPAPEAPSPPTVPTPPPPSSAEPSSPAPADEGFQDLSSLTAEALAEADQEQASQGAVASGLSRFGRRDPHDRAKRLARVLVSDIIAYYPDKHAAALREGRVRETFEEEVEKSRREYIEQVGREMADSTDYFRVALNEVLARGENIY